MTYSYTAIQSNYFKVSDILKFKETCSNYGVEWFVQDDFVSFHGSVDECFELSGYYCEKSHQRVNIDFLSQISGLLVPGQICILSQSTTGSSGAVDFRIEAVNLENKRANFELEDIEKLAKQLLGGLSHCISLTDILL